MRIRRLLFLLLLLFLFASVSVHAPGLSGPGTAEAQETGQERPLPADTVRVEADKLTFDQTTMAGTATGG